MKTVLVIGASGFVGSHALQCLQKLQHVKLIAACRDPQRLRVPFDGDIRQGDLRDPDYVSALLDGVDVVINAMAWTSLWGHVRESERLFLQPTLQLIDRFLASDAHRYINISTTSAAAPEHSADPMSQGIPRNYWPHLCNVIRIENTLRSRASADKSLVNMRLGIFAGEHYGLGILPILLPRLKTHLVPWVAGGSTGLPLIDGRDIGQALSLAATAEGLDGYQSFNVVGSSTPSIRDVIEYLHRQHGYPKPHFSVPFTAAYGFAWLMEKLDALLPWEPLIVRSVVHLLENTHATNDRARDLLGYQPSCDWRQSVDMQVAEMTDRQQKPMAMARPIY
ncbi:MAG TPA: NAD(P)-dependent oxidoreductase [Pseudomonadales bacterium]